jgi:hypothetical protein
MLRSKGLVGLIIGHQFYIAASDYRPSSFERCDVSRWYVCMCRGSKYVEAGMTRESYITRVYKRLDPRQRQEGQMIQESEWASGQ